VFYTDQVTVKRSDSIRKQNESFDQSSKAAMSNSEKEDIASKSDKQNKKKESPKEVITIQKDENSKSEFHVIHVFRFTLFENFSRCFTNGTKCIENTFVNRIFEFFNAAMLLFIIRVDIFLKLSFFAKGRYCFKVR
jgi:hypothetical protein